MDRRFLCQVCGVKWFAPASRPADEDPVTCAGCGGDLVSLLAPPGIGWQGPLPQTADEGA